MIWRCVLQLQQVQAVVDGVQLLIKMEKALIAGDSIDSLLPSNLDMDAIEAGGTGARPTSALSGSAKSAKSAKSSG